MSEPDAAVVAEGQAAAQAIIDKITQGQDPANQFPVSSGAEHVEEPAERQEINGNSNKRKYPDGEDNPGGEGEEEGGPMRKRASFNDGGGEEHPHHNGEASAQPEEPAQQEGAPVSGFHDAPTGFHDAPVAGHVPQHGLGETPGAATVRQDVVDIPASMVGKLIGKGGETIKNLQFSTRTKVQIDHQTPGEHKRVTIMSSNPEDIEAAKQQIQGLMAAEEGGPRPGDSHRTVECPPGIVGRIIGRGGETIRALQQASQANIVVDQNFPEGVPRKVNISGRPDAVERAAKMITELIQGEPGSAQAIIQKYGAGVQEILECPKGMVGRVIGKGGETIKALQKTYAANIQIDQTAEPMKVTIAGQPQNVQRCAAAVQEIINGGNPFGAGGPGGFGAPGGYGGYGGGYPAAGGYGGYGGYPPAAAPYPAAGGYGYYPPAYPAAGGYGGYGGYADPYAAGGYGGAAASGYGAAGGAGSQAGGQAGGSSVWQELQDGEGRTYYYNSQTGVSQWEKPADT